MHKGIEIGKKILKSKEATISDKYDALFNHHEWNTEEGLAALREAYPYLDQSEFLEHELVFLLGKHASESSLDFLLNILHSPTESPTVRHEAAEALRHFINFKDRVIPELMQYWDSDVRLLRLTIPLSVHKLESSRIIENDSNNNTLRIVEDSDSFTEEELDLYLKSAGRTEADLLQVLLDDKVDEFTKYKIIYTLGNRRNKASALLLSNLLLSSNLEKTTPLFRHDVGALLGEMEKSAMHDEVREAMRENMENSHEEPVVKHEVIVAYIELWGEDDCIERQRESPCRLIRESTQIGIH